MEFILMLIEESDDDEGDNFFIVFGVGFIIVLGFKVNRIVVYSKVYKVRRVWRFRIIYIYCIVLSDLVVLSRCFIDFEEKLIMSIFDVYFCIIIFYVMLVCKVFVIILFWMFVWIFLMFGLEIGVGCVIYENDKICL